MQRTASHRQQDWTELSFASFCTWTNKHKLEFKHANRKRCERAQFSTRAQGVLCAQGTGRETRLKSLKRLNLPLLALVKWWFFSANDEIVRCDTSEIVSMCLYKNNYVYEGQKQKLTVCEPFTILKEKSDKKSWDSFNIFLTRFIHKGK